MSYTCKTTSRSLVLYNVALFTLNVYDIAIVCLAATKSGQINAYFCLAATKANKQYTHKGPFLSVSNQSKETNSHTPRPHVSQGLSI